MTILNNDNIQDVLYSFNNFHDGSIASFNYDTFNNEIEVILDAYRWNKESYKFNTQPIKCKVTLIFKNIEKLDMHEIYYWDFIFKASIRKEEVNGQNIFTFIDDEDNQNIIISWREILINSIDIK